MAQSVDQEFLLEFFGARTSRKPQTDKHGDYVWNLWRILNKCQLSSKNPELHYEIQYWEQERAGDDPVFTEKESVMKQNYPNEVREWEKHFGDEWQAKYDKSCRIWPGKSSTKRNFDETPSKAKQPLKKSKIDSDDEDEDEDDNSGDGASLFDSPTGPTPSTHAMGPPPTPARRPAFKFGSPSRSRSRGRAIDPDELDDDIEDSEEDGGVLLQDSDEDSDDDVLIRSIRSGSVSAGLTSIYNQSQKEFEDDEIADSQIDQSQLLDDDVDDDTGSQGSGQASPPSPIDRCEEYSKILIAAHSHSIHSLVQATLDLERMPCNRWIDKRKAGSQFDYDDLVMYLVVMLLGMDGLVLEHFVRGDIAAAQLQNPVLRRKLRSMEKSGSCPSIYSQYLVDPKTGISPNVGVLLEALDSIDLYTRGSGTVDKDSCLLAIKIDNAISTLAKSPQHHLGERRYLQNATQKTVCENWSKILRARVLAHPTSSTLDRPLAEVGYATKPVERLKQHAKHSSSNYLMNLMEATLMTKHNNKYRMVQFVVFEDAHLTHAMYAEIMLTRIALGYVTEGGGFSHCQAGISHPGADNVPDDYYEKKQATLYKSAPFKTRLREEIAAKDREKRIYDDTITTAEECRDANEKMMNLDTAMEDLGERVINIILVEGKRRTAALDNVEALMNLAAEDVDISDDD